MVTRQSFASRVAVNVVSLGRLMTVFSLYGIRTCYDQSPDDELPEAESRPVRKTR